MNRRMIVIVTIMMVIGVPFITKNYAEKSLFTQFEKSEKIVYEGTDPKGDHIEIQIDKTLTPPRITHINHTTGGTTKGPYEFFSVPQGPDTGGFSNIYRADIGSGAVDYIMFMEYPNAMVIYQQYDASGNEIGNPVYGAVSQSLPNDHLYETAYNYMRFNARQPIAFNADMQCGFIAFDTSTENGLMYGAGYSKKAESNPSASHGIRSLSGQFNVDQLQTNLSTDSRYVNIDGSISGEDKLVLIGTPSESIILDFGLGLGGGSGLMLKQSTSPGWKAIYEGTYYIKVYRYATSTDESNLFDYKLVFTTDTVTGEGHLDVFEFNNNTSSGTPIFSSDLKAISDFDASESPGGLVPLIEQFEDIAENDLAVSDVVKNAHQSHGAFVGGDAHTRMFIMFDNSGMFGGSTSVITDGAGNNVFEFGMMVKDPAYSNDGLEALPPIPPPEPPELPECIIPLLSGISGQDTVSGLSHSHDGPEAHLGIDFQFNDWPPAGSTPEFTTREVIAPCDAQVIEVVESTDIVCPGFTVNIYMTINNGWNVYLGLETYRYDPAIIEAQTREIYVAAGDHVSQGELIARFVISDSLSLGNYPTIHWGIVPKIGGETLPEVCPYDYMTLEAKTEYDAMSLRILGYEHSDL